MAQDEPRTGSQPQPDPPIERRGERLESALGSGGVEPGKPHEDRTFAARTQPWTAEMQVGEGAEGEPGQDERTRDAAAPDVAPQDGPDPALATTPGVSSQLGEVPGGLGGPTTVTDTSRGDA